MATRRKYTAKDRAEAVGIALVAGQTAAAEQTGIPKTTIDYWMDKPEFEQLRTRTREEFEQALWTGLQVGVQAIVEGFKTGELRDRATAFGVLYDRYALMTGQVTARTESRSVTEGLNDHERATLRDIIDDALAAAPALAEGAAG